MVTLKGGEGVERALQDLARKMDKPATLRVGFLEGATYPDGTSVAMVAVTQNYGSPSRGIPPRPFFSKMIAEKSPGWPDKLRAVFRAAGNDGRRALELFGEGVAGQLREAVVEMADPPLSPVTLLLHDRFPSGDGYTFADVLQARRDIAAGEVPSGAHSNPLVWSGHLLNSVDKEVV
jgi:hypothetical protein